MLQGVPMELYLYDVARGYLEQTQIHTSNWSTAAVYPQCSTFAQWAFEQ
jgi:hypothetical protein